MRPLAFAALACDEFPRQRGLLPRHIALLIEGVDATARDVGQRKIRIGCDRTIESFRRARPCREQQVDALTIGVGRVGRVC